MTERGPLDYIQHMREAAQQACLYVEGMALDEFVQDKRTQQAVVLNLVVLGEAATRLLKDHASFLADYPGVPWTSMKGMRNRLAHGYFDIDLAVVWETLQVDLPSLLAALSTMLAAEGSDPHLES